MKVKRPLGVMYRIGKRITVTSAVIYASFKAFIHLSDKHDEKKALVQK